MLDANEQAKGGFGAAAARERERRDDRAAANPEAGEPVTDGTAPTPHAAASVSPAPAGRQPKRWR